MSDFLQELQSRLGSPLLINADISARYQHDWSSEPAGVPIAVARPGSTGEVAAIMQVCSQHGQKVVVQGGLSGLCGGGNPRSDELAISLERLSGIEEIDHASMTMTVKAGTPLHVAVAISAATSRPMPAGTMCCVSA